MRWNPFRRASVDSDPDSDADRLDERVAGAEVATEAGRYELARAEFSAVVDECRQRLADRPDDVEVTALLAAALSGLVPCLEKLRRFEELGDVLDEGTQVSRRAVELRRAAADGTPDPGMARTLRTFALVRADAGVELDEADAALHEAMALHMAALTATPCDEHLAETYATERAQARVLARRGKHVEAARVTGLARSGHLDGLLDLLRAQRGP